MESVNYLTSGNKEIKDIDSFNNDEHQQNLKIIEQLKIEQKKEDEDEITKLKLLCDLDLVDFWLKTEDFKIMKKNGTTIIVSNSSYFSSIVWLNWIQEKQNSRKLKDRSKYDDFDKLLNDLLKNNVSKEEAQTQLEKYCKENKLDFESIIAWGGCVIWEWDLALVWIKRIVWDSWDILEKNKWTIIHESQHIKFDNYCKEKSIEQKWILRLLSEVIAHCTNTKNAKWDIDFDKILKTMKDNKNYLSISWFTDKQDFEEALKNLINQTQKELKNKDIDSAMEYLIEQNK